MHENPLVNNKKLRQLYVAMAGARALDEYALRKRGRGKSAEFGSTRGEEACRVSTAIELVDGDLVSDTHAGVVMDFVAGVAIASLLRRMVTPASGGRGQRAKSSHTKGAGQMPWIEDAGERLRMAVGAALGFKALKHCVQRAFKVLGTLVAGYHELHEVHTSRKNCRILLSSR